MSLDVAALNDEIASVKQTLNFTWADLKIFFKAQLAAAGSNGGVTSYTIAGRVVTKSLSEIREMLDIAESRAGGGMVRQLGEFG